MKEIGAWLKEERTSRGVTLEQIRDETKIGTHYLQALEDGAMHRLPGEAYVRAYIRAYARSVGFDPTPVLRKYQELQLKESFTRERAAKPPSKSVRFFARVNKTLQWFGL